MDDDRVDAVISHLEGVNTTLKSLRSQGGDLEPFLGSEQVKSHFLESNQIYPKAELAQPSPVYHLLPVTAFVKLYHSLL